MTNLIKLLQPKEYNSKLKLYCKTCKVDNISPKTFAQVKNKSYICRVIEIKEI
jgi:hypothetical protein